MLFAVSLHISFYFFSFFPFRFRLASSKFLQPHVTRDHPKQQPQVPSLFSRLQVLMKPAARFSVPLKEHHPRPLKRRECASVPQDECCGIRRQHHRTCFVFKCWYTCINRWCKMIIGLFSNFSVCLLLCVEVNINYMCVHSYTYTVCIFVVCYWNSFYTKPLCWLTPIEESA